MGDILELIGFDSLLLFKYDYIKQIECCPYLLLYKSDSDRDSVGLMTTQGNILIKQTSYSITVDFSNKTGLAVIHKYRNGYYEETIVYKISERTDKIEVTKVWKCNDNYLILNEFDIGIVIEESETGEQIFIPSYGVLKNDKGYNNIRVFKDKGVIICRNWLIPLISVDKMGITHRREGPRETFDILKLDGEIIKDSIIWDNITAKEYGLNCSTLRKQQSIWER